MNEYYTFLKIIYYLTKNNLKTIKYCNMGNKIKAFVGLNVFFVENKLSNFSSNVY